MTNDSYPRDNSPKHTSGSWNSFKGLSLAKWSVNLGSYVEERKSRAWLIGVYFIWVYKNIYNRQPSSHESRVIAFDIVLN